MIMISDMTQNNFTSAATPSWMKADNFDVLMNQKDAEPGLLDRIRSFLTIR